MRSIRFKLTLQLAVAMALLSLIGGGALFLSLRHMLNAEFDRSLMLRAHALQSLITQTSGGKLDLDLRLPAFPEFSRAEAPEFYSLEDDQGNRLTASSEYKITTNDADGDRWDTVLASGQRARALRLTFQPTIDDEEAESATVDKPPGRLHRLTLTLARETEGLRQTIWVVGALIGVTFAALSLMTILASTWIVRNGLKALVNVASKAAKLDLKKNNVRFETAALPGELSPILAKFNEALAVLNDALAREKRFTAAVSHELRTPISELRAAADIALRDPANLDLAVRSARHAQASAERLQTIVSTLLSIASFERAAEPIRLGSIDLAESFGRVLHVRANDFRDARIVIDSRISPATQVRANPALLDAVFDNLLSNVAQYASSGSTLLVESSIDGSDVAVSFTNTQSHLTADDVSSLFEPFWRKDAARSGGTHVGLGLALTRTYCEAMGASISAALSADGRLRIVVVLTAETGTSDSRRASPSDVSRSIRA